jgi:hypothetical protein
VHSRAPKYARSEAWRVFGCKRKKKVYKVWGECVGTDGVEEKSLRWSVVSREDGYARRS